MSTDNSKKVEVLTFGGGARHWQSVIESTEADCLVRCAPNRKDLPSGISETSMLVGWRFPDQLFDQLPNVRFIQCLSVGVERLVENPHIGPEVKIANTGGLYGDAVAEYAQWALLTLFRRFHVVLENQRRRRWRQIFGHGVAGKTVGIVGVGDIGRRIASHAKAMKMKTVGYVHADHDGGLLDDIDDVRAMQDFPANVGDLDALVLSVPLTEETQNLIDSECIDNLKSSAVLVNLSRQPLIEGSVVIDALRDGRLAGAAMDVFDKEPLRPWSPMWRVPNLIVTPHLAALRSDYKTRVADLLSRNVVRFAAGEPIINEVQRKRGY